MVAPYSGHILLIVARSAIDNSETPGPKNSTNFPTTPNCLKFFVIYDTNEIWLKRTIENKEKEKLLTVSTKSVEVASRFNFPINL